jgi:U3 small nucleolar RNA-associated protein 7
MVDYHHNIIYSSIVIPGSGEPNLDSTEHFTNPYMDNKQRRETEVRSLLEKLRPEMIALDPDVIGSIEESNLIQKQQRLRDLAESADAKKASEKEASKNKKQKKKMRGRNKISKKLARKQKNVIDEGTEKLKEARDQERSVREREEKNKNEGDDQDNNDAPAALRRFF